MERKNSTQLSNPPYPCKHREKSFRKYEKIFKKIKLTPAQIVENLFSDTKCPRCDDDESSESAPSFDAGASSVLETTESFTPGTEPEAVPGNSREPELEPCSMAKKPRLSDSSTVDLFEKSDLRDASDEGRLPSESVEEEHSTSRRSSVQFRVEDSQSTTLEPVPMDADWTEPLQVPPSTFDPACDSWSKTRKRSRSRFSASDSSGFDDVSISVEEISSGLARAVFGGRPVFFGSVGHPQFHSTPLSAPCGEGREAPPPESVSGSLGNPVNPLSTIFSAVPSPSPSQFSCSGPLTWGTFKESLGDTSTSTPRLPVPQTTEPAPGPHGVTSYEIRRWGHSTKGPFNHKVHKLKLFKDYAYVAFVRSPQPPWIVHFDRAVREEGEFQVFQDTAPVNEDQASTSSAGQSAPKILVIHRKHRNQMGKSLPETLRLSFSTTKDFEKMAKRFFPEGECPPLVPGRSKSRCRAATVTSSSAANEDDDYYNYLVAKYGNRPSVVAKHVVDENGRLRPVEELTIRRAYYLDYLKIFREEFPGRLCPTYDKFCEDSVKFLLNSSYS